LVEWITPDVLPRYRAYAENEKRKEKNGKKTISREKRKKIYII